MRWYPIDRFGSSPFWRSSSSSAVCIAAVMICSCVCIGDSAVCGGGCAVLVVLMCGCRLLVCSMVTVTVKVLTNLSYLLVVFRRLVLVRGVLVLVRWFVAILGMGRVVILILSRSLPSVFLVQRRVRLLCVGGRLIGLGVARFGGLVLLLLFVLLR